MDGSTEMKWSEWSDTLEKIECCCQEMGKEKGGIVVECVQSFCFARGKKVLRFGRTKCECTWKWDRLLTPQVLSPPSVCGKSLGKSKFNPRSESTQKQRKTVKGEQIIIIW